MNLDVISYIDIQAADSTIQSNIQKILQEKGIIGIRGVPNFERLCENYISAAREFSLLEDEVKHQYAPNRDAGETEGYEIGAEWFKDERGDWQIDDKKASYYAFVPDHPKNKWPTEMDFASHYQALGKAIFQTGKLLLNALGLDDAAGLKHNNLVGYGRMLHYHKENAATIVNPNWCGAHTDHGVFTGLIPAYYYQNGEEIDEPQEAGLFIIPSNGRDFEKINASDKSILLFQVGEFGQLISNDKIKATKHVVKKAEGSIERFTFALFYSADPKMIIQSSSMLTKDPRYAEQEQDGKISYDQWEKASFEQYKAK